jgi:UDP-N-acetylglucosamine 2-epimerase (non-hydrolysing)/GDP/UDP-N,N'-diacetylbacillosamine 2-epimerase (hydrolysing)
MRTIGVVTGTRADYGLLRWLLQEIQDDPALHLQIIATGMHLSNEFGLTYRQIEADGYVLDAKVEMLLSSDTPASISKSMGVGMLGFADALARLRPDILVILGDRFEALVATQTAMIARIPVAHLHGGEISEGAVDESIRHAITKMVQWHFVAAEPYRQRVVQMGEAPDRVFNVGAPGLDNLTRIDWLGRKELEQDLQITLRPPLFLITYHPATLGNLDPTEAMKALLSALDAFPQATLLFTYPNADAGGRALIPLIEAYVAAHPERAKAFASLGQRRYLSLMRLADAVIGNSSSGLTEAPALKKATVNIGERQQGRLKARSVLDATESADAIAAAITRALSGEFQATLASTVSLYGQGDVCRKIKDILKNAPLREQKSFFDIPHEH